MWQLALALLAISVGALAWHVVEWRKSRRHETDPTEYDFYFRQFRRRLQASAMIGLLGAAIYFGSLISPQASPLAFVLYWLGVVLLALWLLLLALADAIATRAHLGRLQRRSLSKLGELRRELAAQEERRSKGDDDASQA